MKNRFYLRPLKLRAAFLFKALLLFVLFPFCLQGQSYFSRSYTVTDGLASPTINDINQDISGRMWFATAAGVSSYDGTTWVNYSSIQGLPKKEYYRIFPSSRGEIWTMTRTLTDGLYVFKPKTKRWHHITSPESVGSDSCLISSAARLEIQNKLYIAVGTIDYGLFIYCDKDGWVYPLKNHDLTHYHIQVIEANRGFFYLSPRFEETSNSQGKSEPGLFKISPQAPNNWKSKIIKTPGNQIYSIAFEKKSKSRLNKLNSKETRMWLIGKKWIGYYSRNRFHLLFDGDIPGFPKKFLYNHCSILPDRFGGLWIANDQAFLNLNSRGQIKIMGKPQTLNALGAYCLFWDRESNLWFGTHRGAIKIISFRFENYRAQDGLLEDEVSAISQMDNGQMIFGHNGGFTFFKDNRFETFEVPNDNSRIINDSRVMDISIDKKGNAWAAVSQAGIVKINPNKQMNWYKIKTDNPGEQTNITVSSVLVDRSGKIWVCGDNYIFERQNNHFIPLNKVTKTRSYFRRIIQGEGDTLYFTNNREGIFILKNDKFEKIKCENNNEANSTFSVFSEKNGNILVGTKIGLYQIEGNKLVKFPPSVLEIEQPIYFITEDPDENLWFGLIEGVVRWDGVNARHYSMKDGLAGHETNRAAGFIDRSGRIWIGTERGVSRYYKEKDKNSQTPPLIELSYLKVSRLDKLFPLDRDLFFNYREDDLFFHFQGISFIDEDAITYNFKLYGVDQEWLFNYQLQQNQIRYFNVSPGKYRFHIQAVNCLGIKSPIVSSAIITIRSPFYQKSWFYISIFLVILLLIILTANYISRRHYAHHLENEILQRTGQLKESERELREIFNNAHDAILVFDPQTEIIYKANKRASEIYGYPLEEFIGMSLESISKDINRGKNKITETLQAGDCLTFETVQFRKDGSEMFLEVNASIINYRGKLSILSLNRDITERKHTELQIQNSLKEKELLLKEIHHRVKNNLQIISSLLDLQVDTLQNQEIIKVFQDSKNRIRAMALIHENLYSYGDLARIDGLNYIQELLSSLLDIFREGGVRIDPEIDIELPTFAVDMDTAIPLGLILTELISNALKHAFPNQKEGKIQIRLYPTTPGTVVLVVSDNGIGLPEEIDIHKSKTLGLQLISLLTQQIKGSIHLKRNNGTTFAITFPYKP